MTEHRDIIDVRLPERAPESESLRKAWDYAYWAGIAIFIVSLVMLTYAAFAQAPTAATPEPSALSVALSNALIALLAIVVPVVGTFLTLALNRLRAKWGLEATAQDRSNLDTELKAAAAVGIAKVAPIDPLTPATHAEAVSHAAEYFVKRFPERTATIVAATGAFTADETKDAVAEMIAGRLPDVVAAPAAPVVVVPGASVKP